jgi:hypothetical protein
MGRIEHTLFDRGRSSTPSDLRPSPATPPYHTKVTDVSIYDKGTGHPEGYPRPTGHLLIFCAAAARDGLEDLYLFAGTGVLDKMPDVDDALEAGVR